MSGEPILGKHPAMPQWDHKPMTWARLLRLRRWAQEVADQEQAPVYLVGSALYKARPRDIDVSIILPYDRFVAQFGPIPSDPESRYEDPRGMGNYMQKLAHYLGSPPRCYIQHGMRAIRDRTRLDLKICPDSWWPENDKLLLAAPRRVQAEENAA